jgi:cytochrome c oxidase cbb3-type subunit 3
MPAMRHLWNGAVGIVILTATAVIGSSGQTPPATQPPAPGAGRGQVPSGPRPNVGAADRHRVDPAGADRGRKTYAAECVTCHGPGARGTERGPNLIRSPIVLRDRYGNSIGPVLKKGHPMQTAASSAALTDAQVTDLSHFIWQRINDTLRGSDVFEPGDVLVGDSKAGEVYFNGEGKCATCHSVTGDLTGYGKRFQPVDIQQRFVFPNAAGGRGRGRAAGPTRQQVTVTVTLPDGSTSSGALVSMDDFHVALRTTAGDYRSFSRTPAMKIVKTEPLAAHVELLDRLTDKAMHDVVAYLESLK